MVMYELKKIWRRKVFIIAFVLLVVLDAAKIITESNKNSYESSFERSRSKLYSQVEGTWEMETITYVVSTYQNASSIVYSGNYSTEPDQPGTYTGYIFGDFSLFGEVYEKMNYMYNYSSSMEATLQKAEENIELYERFGNKYKVCENEKILEMYSGRDIPAFYDTDGAFRLISYDLSTVMTLLIMVLAVAPMFTCEKETEMNLLLRTSARGGRNLITAKIIAALITTVSIAAVFTIADIASFSVAYKIKCFGLPLYSIAQFRNTPLTCTIVEYLFIDFGYKIAGMLIMALLYLITSAVSPDEIISFCCCFGITLLLIFTGSSYSPVRLMTSREMFVSFSAVNIYGRPVMAYIAVIPVAIAALGVLTGGVFLAGSRKRIGRFSMKALLTRVKEHLT